MKSTIPATSPVLLLLLTAAIITSSSTTLAQMEGAIPKLPQTCGFVYDDPHIVTYDRLVYECQAEGDYILSKSLATDDKPAFELQARYHRGESWGWTRTGDPGTTTIGAVLKTGYDGEPIVEVGASTTPEGTCQIDYYIDGQLYNLESIVETQFQTTINNDNVQFYNRGSSRYFFFQQSGLSLRLSIQNHKVFGCFLNVKLCIPDDIVETEPIVGQLGSPDGDKLNDFMTRDGTLHELEPVLHSYPEGYWSDVHDYCTQTWCVHSENSLFQEPSANSNCEATPYKGTVEQALETENTELKDLCGDDVPCLVDGDNAGGDTETAEKTLQDGRELEGEEKIPETNDDASDDTTPKQQANVYGDPHFKTWTGDKFDYHGECDLVLVDNPTFNNGQGLKLHIRTTRVQYYSYIERVALQIGSDVLEFANDVDNFLLNGQTVPPQRKHHNTTVGGFLLRRDHKAISVRLDAASKTKIDFIHRVTGFPAVVVDAGSNPTIFKGSLGLLGEWGTGKWIARDGKTNMKEHGGAAIFALEWQVRASGDEPMLFQQGRHPQFPTRCLPPKKNTLLMGTGRGRLGMKRAKKLAQKACSHWNVEDQAECIFDVLATRNAKVALEAPSGTHGMVE